MPALNKTRMIATGLMFTLWSVGALGTPAVAADTSRFAMMDEMKMKSDPNSSGAMGDNMKKMQPSDSSMQPQSGSDMMMQMMNRMMCGQMNMPGSSQMNMPGSANVSGPADVTERIEGRIAFLKAELQISDKQAADWNALADALRSSRQHLLDARKQLTMDQKMTGNEKIDRYERHLSERLEAIKSARSAFNRLYQTLNDSQRETANAIVLPLIATF